MELTSLLVLMVGGLIAAPQMVVAIGSGDAAAMYNAYNNAFLYRNGGTAYYKKSLSDSGEDGSWTEDLDAMVVLDAYEQTGDPDKLALIEDLFTTWLVYNPPPYNGDGWNDDVGWYALGLMRAYQYTGNSQFFDVSKAAYDMAYTRGWDTAHNGGGIWELQPEDDPSPANKCVLSNNSLGRVACMIYQATHDANYLNQCTQIYDWVWHNLFVPTTGEVFGCIEQNGQIDYGDDPYNQGSMADMANLLWLINNEATFLNDAELAISYAFNHVTTNGIFSAPGNNGGWTDDLTRGMGRTVWNNRLWDAYYGPMVANANAIVQNRRSDLGITWNGWDTPTPLDNSQLTGQMAGAAAWLWWVPANQPNNIAGLHVITNQQTGMAIDSMGTFGSGQSVNQWGADSGSLNQRWLLSQNSDTSWNIISTSTWQALDCPNGAATNNLGMIQWQPTRGSNQRWWIDQQPNGAYKIWNQASELALDGSSSTQNGYPLTQWPFNGGPQQLWNLQ